MNTIDILVVVDAHGAFDTCSLQDNVYLIDTNKHVGSYRHGTSELVTACLDNQGIKWRVTSVSPDCYVEIVQFTGEMIDTKVCSPQKQGPPQDVFWQGFVQARGDVGTYQYSIVIKIHCYHPCKLAVEESPLLTLTGEFCFKAGKLMVNEEKPSQIKIN